MTAERRREIEALLAALPPGTWYPGPHAVTTATSVYSLEPWQWYGRRRIAIVNDLDHDGTRGEAAIHERAAVAVFIAAAPAIIRELLAALEPVP